MVAKWWFTFGFSPKTAALRGKRDSIVMVQNKIVFLFFWPFWPNGIPQMHQTSTQEKEFTLCHNCGTLGIFIISWCRGICSTGRSALSINGQFATDILGQHSGPMFKGRHAQFVNSPWSLWHSKMGLICCLETLGTTYPLILQNVPEEWRPRPQLLFGKGIKSSNPWCCWSAATLSVLVILNCF